MKLVEWSSDLTSGVGRTGSHYSLAYDPPKGDAPGLWQIAVDSVTVCGVDSAGEAIVRSEGLEAMRCVLRGISRGLQPDHLHRAASIATEMTAAAERALSELPIADDRRVEISQSLDALQSLARMINDERSRRQREEDHGPPRC
jgi:hypothetical protein